MLKAEFEELIQQILKNHPDVTREEAEMLVLTGGGVRPRAVYEPTPELRGRRESRGVTPLTWHELDAETGVSPRHRTLPRRETGEIFRSEANPARASASHRGRGSFDSYHHALRAGQWFNTGARKSGLTNPAHTIRSRIVKALARLDQHV